MKYTKTETQVVAAAKAGMSLGSARKYTKNGGRMSKWTYRRTHPDAFAGVWSTVEQMLSMNSGLQSQTIMQYLIDEYPESQFRWGQLRTLQRRMRDWRGLKGPEQDVKFPQNHIPGKQSQSDWTHCDELGVTIDGHEYPHKLFHFMLPYSRWETAHISNAESFDNLTQGFERAAQELGFVAEEHRTDNLTAAVNSHGERPVFNERWSAFLGHYGVVPSRNNPGESHENGSVEKSHDLLKNALRQALMLRCSRDFASVEDYEKFIRRVLEQRNRGRQKRLAVELATMKGLPQEHWDDHKEVAAGVTSFSTISVDKVVYSVPSRLIGRKLRALVYPELIRVFLGGTLVQEMARMQSGSRKINYRHVVGHLLRKPGAFANYQYREELFPSVTFRQAFDELREACPERADREYLAILNLAAMNSEQDVEAALAMLREAGQVPSSELVKELIQVALPAVPDLVLHAPDLCSYDQLLTYLTRAPKETV